MEAGDASISATSLPGFEDATHLVWESETSLVRGPDGQPIEAFKVLLLDDDLQPKRTLFFSVETREPFAYAVEGLPLMFFVGKNVGSMRSYLPFLPLRLAGQDIEPGGVAPLCFLGHALEVRNEGGNQLAVSFAEPTEGEGAAVIWKMRLRGPHALPTLIEEVGERGPGTVWKAGFPPGSKVVPFTSPVDALHSLLDDELAADRGEWGRSPPSETGANFPWPVEDAIDAAAREEPDIAGFLARHPEARVASGEYEEKSVIIGAVRLVRTRIWDLTLQGTREEIAFNVQWDASVEALAGVPVLYSTIITGHESTEKVVPATEPVPGALTLAALYQVCLEEWPAASSFGLGFTGSPTQGTTLAGVVQKYGAVYGCGLDGALSGNVVIDPFTGFFLILPFLEA